MHILTKFLRESRLKFEPMHSFICRSPCQYLSSRTPVLTTKRSVLGHIGADRRQPIWLGTIDRQSRHEDLRLMVTARDQAGYDRAGLYLARQLAAQGIAIHWPDASGRGPLLFSLDAPDTPGTKAYAPMLK